MLELAGGGGRRAMEDGLERERHRPCEWARERLLDFVERERVLMHARRSLLSSVHLRAVRVRVCAAMRVRGCADVRGGSMGGGSRSRSAPDRFLRLRPEWSSDVGFVTVDNLYPFSVTPPARASFVRTVRGKLGAGTLVLLAWSTSRRQYAPIDL